MPLYTANIFRAHLNAVFVETGSFRGDGIQQALDAGFPSVRSVELSPKYYDHCRERFKDRPEVRLYLGDSAEILGDVISDINQNITFWLDGHHSCGDTALGKFWAPLMQELEHIGAHPIKDHIVMIDDMRCWREPNPTHGFSTPDLIAKLNQINPGYDICRAPGLDPDDVLIARPGGVMPAMDRLNAAFRQDSTPSAPES